MRLEFAVLVGIILLLAGLPNLIDLVDNRTLEFDQVMRSDVGAGCASYIGEENCFFWIMVLSTSFKSGLVALTVFFVALTTGFVLSVVWVGLLRTFELIFSGMRFIPSVAWLPVLVIIGAFNDYTGEFLFIALGIAPFVLFRVLEAIAHTDNEKIAVGKLASARRVEIFGRIILPNALDQVVNSFRFGVALAFILSLIYTILFESLWGIPRIVDPIGDVRLPVGNAIGFMLIVVCCGIGADRVVMLSKKSIQAMWDSQARKSWVEAKA